MYESCYTTPQRVTAVSTLAGLDSTPGRRTVQLQAEVFTEERFVEVFGEDGLNALLRILGSDTINGRKSFNTLADTAIPYDDHRKRILFVR